MSEFIKKIRVCMDDPNFWILSFELILFSGVYGITYTSWLVFGIMAAGLFWLLSRRWGTVYMIFVMSFLWGIVAFSLFYEASLNWAMIWGGFLFLVGIRVHFRDLKRPLVRATVVPVDDDRMVMEWQRNGYLGRQIIMKFCIQHH